MKDFGAVPELQKVLQSAQGHIHLRGKGDRLTSVVIPIGFAVVAAGTVVTSLYGMYTGTSKMD